MEISQKYVDFSEYMNFKHMHFGAGVVGKSGQLISHPVFGKKLIENPAITIFGFPEIVFIHPDFNCFLRHCCIKY